MRLLVKQTVSLAQKLIRQRSIMTSTSSQSSGNKDHLEVTKDQSRHPSLHDARVEVIRDISPTVKELILKVEKAKDGSKLQFLPGQWLDVYLPNVDKVGGFSLTSTPRLMNLEDKVTLAVKHSTWAPAFWIHTKCQPGSKLQIQCGGDFYLSPSQTISNSDYLFVAGGVGINPIASMIFHLHEIKNAHNITLLYSAKCQRELIFREQFDALAAQNPKFKVEYYVTCTRLASECKPIDWASSFKYHARRITKDDLQVHRDKITYICGPPPLIQLVTQSGDQFKEVHFEKWWISEDAAVN